MPATMPRDSPSHPCVNPASGLCATCVPVDPFSLLAIHHTTTAPVLKGTSYIVDIGTSNSKMWEILKTGLFAHCANPGSGMVNSEDQTISHGALRSWGEQSIHRDTTSAFAVIKK